MANKYKKRMVPNDDYMLGGILQAAAGAATQNMDNKMLAGGINAAAGILGMGANSLTGMPLVNLLGGEMAEGGPISEFNTGGTHEQNPNGGIPVGNGKSVEQGETRNNDQQYVYSDRLIVDKELAEEFSLPKKAIGKSFADVSKMFKDDERPNDPITKRGVKRNLENLTAAQEAFKAVNKVNDTPAQTGQMAPGGFIDNIGVNILSLLETLPIGGVKPRGIENIDFTPNKPFVIDQESKDEPYIEGVNAKSPFEFQLGDRTPVSNLKDRPGAIPQSTFDNTGSQGFNIDPSVLRYAGTLSDVGALAYLFATKEDPKNIDMFNTDSKFQENLVDRGQQIRDIDSSTGALLQSIRNATGGNAAAFLNNAAGAVGRVSTAKAQAGMASDVADTQEKARVQTARFQQDLYNQRNRMQTQMMNDQDAGQFDTNILDTLTNIGNNMTDIGNEEYYKKLINALPFLYNTRGEFKGTN